VIEHNAVLMRIYLSESHRRGRSAVYRRLIEELLSAGFRGAAAFRGIEGFGSHRRISADWVVDAPGDLPILIEVADDIERVRAFLPILERVLDDGLVTLERIRRVTGKPCAFS
jgi:PII-like signaling protein